MTTLFVCLLLVLLDLFVVRDYSWLVDNWDIKRVVLNFGLSSLAMLSLLFILKPILTKSSISKNIVFVLIKTPALEYKLLKMAKITNCFIFAFAFSVGARACR